MEGGGDSTQYDHLARGSSGGRGSSKSKADVDRLRVAAQYRSLQAQLAEPTEPLVEVKQVPHTHTSDPAHSRIPQAPSAAAAAAKSARPDEARMLRDMFKAIWPDLSGAKSWTSATKVASMTGSLSLSLAFFGVVYLLSTKYDHTSRQEPDTAKPKET